VFVVHHNRKPAPGPHDPSLFHILKLQATADVKDDPDLHRDVRVMPPLLNTQLPSPSAFEYASLERG
jgi:hypothetical protein